MKKILLLSLIIILAFSCSSCSNKPHNATSVVNPTVLPDSSVDPESQMQSTPKATSPTPTTGIGATVLPISYDKASSFHEGLAYFEIGDQYGFMDKSGKHVFYLECDSVSSFNEGLAYYSIDGKYGYIDVTGKVVIKPIYDDAGYFKNGAAKVRLNDKVGIINKSGQEIVPISYDDVYEDNGIFITVLDDKKGCANSKGKIILPTKYTEVYVENGTINYSINDKWNIVNANGDVTKTSVTKSGSDDDLSSLLLENEITPKIKLFHDYIQNFQIEDPYFGETTTNVNQLEDYKKTFRLYKLDGSDNPVLYVNVQPIDPGNSSYSGFFSIHNNKVNTLISGAECGGTMGGDYVCLSKDNVTSKIVISTYNYAGGFGGNAYGSDFYNIINGNAKLITSYQQICQDSSNYNKSDLIKNAKLFYGDNGLPYTKNTISKLSIGQYVTEYNVNEKLTTVSKFNEVLRRFRNVNVDVSK